MKEPGLVFSGSEKYIFLYISSLILSSLHCSLVKAFELATCQQQHNFINLINNRKS